MSTYKELQAQIEKLQQQAEETRQKEIRQVIEEVHAKMREFGLTVDDLQSGSKARGSRKGSGQPVAPKYRNDSTGETWSGRGKPPKWLVGKDRAAYLIK